MQKIKIPAKLNLTLDITGQSGGYHMIDSLVCSVNLYDTILVSKRKDKKILLKTRGINPECLVENNNAYKTALLFCEKEKQFDLYFFLKKDVKPIELPLLYKPLVLEQVAAAKNPQAYRDSYTLYGT